MHIAKYLFALVFNMCDLYSFSFRCVDMSLL